MKKALTLMLAAAMLPAFAPASALAQSQSLDEIFNRVSPTVVVVRAKGRDVKAAGITPFNETGSGVLISSDGRVMTAAHVVNGMDEITVEGASPARSWARRSSRRMRRPMSRSCSSSA
jgi:S1-C subfamily serine protease